MFEAGILFDPGLVIYGEWNKESGYQGMKDLKEKGVTAVFCMSDAIAAGTYQYLFEAGIKPGEDISIMGFDNQEIASLLTPAVTTMALPLEKIGHDAAAKLIEMIEEPEQREMEDGTTDIRIPSMLIERNSVASL